MSKKINKKSYRLLVVAHPDDETIFFSAPLMQLRDKPWLVICVTNGNADGAGLARAQQFKKACQKLKVDHSIQMEFPDIYERRINIDQLIQSLSILETPSEVYTHSIVGDYGHPHHQDVSYATHKVFANKTKVWSLAYNCAADRTMTLTKPQYKLKSEIYAQIYAGETLRFANFLPNNSSDHFCQLQLQEVEELYRSLSQHKAPQIGRLKKYKWLSRFIKHQALEKTKRPF